jgi:hypothetical protein
LFHHNIQNNDFIFRNNAGPNSNLKPYDFADQPQKPMDVDLVNAFYVQKSILKPEKYEKTREEINLAEQKRRERQEIERNNMENWKRFVLAQNPNYFDSIRPNS